ncbi:hypothetical protein ACLB1O_15780 [Escherichia coli]
MPPVRHGHAAAPQYPAPAYRPANTPAGNKGRAVVVQVTLPDALRRLHPGSSPSAWGHEGAATECR